MIVKAHSAHPGTSELVGRAVQRAVRECGLPEGTFSLLFDSGRDCRQGLVAIRASPRSASPARARRRHRVMRIAASRSVPIPVYAEMSSINR